LVVRRPGNLSSIADAELDPAFATVFVEYCDEVELCAEAGEVTAKRRQLQIVGAFELRDGRLADAEILGNVGLGQAEGLSQLEEIDLGKGPFSVRSKAPDRPRSWRSR
jgi:hypothetical protein